jgi:hypothetical protein
MRIYRVEHGERGHGPYIIPFDEDVDDESQEYYDLTVLAEDLISTHADEDHPAPMHMPRSHVCGFESLGHLEVWFDGFMQALDSEGYVIAEFDVPFDQFRYVEGHGQVAFVKESSQRIDNYPINW